MSMQNNLNQRLLITSLLIAGFLYLNWNQSIRAEHQLPVDAFKFQNERVTIYLSEDRVCKKCTWRFVGNDHVELKNKKGQTGLYRRSEILGATKHPIWRKFAKHSANNTWLAGENIIPSAIEKPTFNY